VKTWDLVLAFLALVSLAFVIQLFGIAEGPIGAVAVLASSLLLFLATQVPAIWWRLRGASRLSTTAMAIAIPLVPLEGWLARLGYLNEGRGGDLQGIEYDMMVLAVPVIVIASGIVSTLICRKYRPDASKAD
jgi:hypothetical protein